jgi:hypothetical protein
MTGQRPIDGRQARLRLDLGVREPQEPIVRLSSCALSGRFADACELLISDSSLRPFLIQLSRNDLLWDRRLCVHVSGVTPTASTLKPHRRYRPDEHFLKHLKHETPTVHDWRGRGTGHGAAHTGLTQIVSDPRRSAGSHVSGIGFRFR